MNCRHKFAIKGHAISPYGAQFRIVCGRCGLIIWTREYKREMDEREAEWLEI